MMMKIIKSKFQSFPTTSPSKTNKIRLAKPTIQIRKPTRAPKDNSHTTPKILLPLVLLSRKRLQIHATLRINISIIIGRVVIIKI